MRSRTATSSPRSTRGWRGRGNLRAELGPQRLGLLADVGVVHAEPVEVGGLLTHRAGARHVALLLQRDGEIVEDARILLVGLVELVDRDVVLLLGEGDHAEELV